MSVEANKQAENSLSEKMSLQVKTKSYLKENKKFPMLMILMKISGVWEGLSPNSPKLVTNRNQSIHFSIVIVVHPNKNERRAKDIKTLIQIQLKPQTSKKKNEMNEKQRFI